MSFNSFVITIASISGVFQGVAWTILSLIGICWHAAANYEQQVSLTADKYETLLNSYLYEAFIRDRATKSGLFIQPTVFFCLMIVYCCFHLIWAISSVLLYLVKQNRYVKITLIKIGMLWIIVSLMILILDIVTFSLFVYDYQFCIREYNDTENLTYKLAFLYSIIVYGIMMTLSARGYVLWFINLIIIGLISRIWITNRSSPIENRNSHKTNIDIQVPRVSIERNSSFPSRRLTEPADFEAPTFRYLQRYDNINYVYDPQIENRLSKYIVK